MAPPAFSDIAKPANDILNKDFYHTSAATLEVKSKAANGVGFTVRGKSGHKQGDVSGSLEGKYVDAPTGLTLTESWSTTNVLDTKVELDNSLAKGFKAEGVFKLHPKDSTFSPFLNLYYKQPMVTARAFFDLYKGPTANVDAVVGDRGFLAGAEAGYDVQKAAFTRYSGAVGYSVPEYTAAVSATNNLSVISAMYYHRVNSQVEAGAKASWDTKSDNNVALEVAGKYRVDPTSFIKAKINDRGIAGLAYNILLRPGVTMGLGASFDTQHLNDATHKVGASFTFEA